MGSCYIKSNTVILFSVSVRNSFLYLSSQWLKDVTTSTRTPETPSLLETSIHEITWIDSASILQRCKDGIEKLFIETMQMVEDALENEIDENTSLSKPLIK